MTTPEPSAFAQAARAVAGGMTPEAAAADLIAHMTPEERLWCLDGDAPTWAGLAFLATGGYHHAPFVAARIPRLGIPGLAFSDGPRGAVVGNATCFPVPMARGATWNVELEREVGTAIGLELRAIGANLTGAVCVNLLRHPAWGRAQETYGEDPHHVGEMGAAFSSGLQDHVIACVKHFACNSMENARFAVDVSVDEVALHEVFLPHFRRVLAAGAGAVMSAYNSVNGEWCGQNADLLTRILRDEWGFDGVVISDWILGIRDAATSLRAGLDVEMPYRMVRATHLQSALDTGTVTWDDVDRAVTHVLATLLRFHTLIDRPAPPMRVLDQPGHRDLARRVAAESVVLLENRSLLPLRAEGTVALFGELAARVNLGDGGSSDVWSLHNVTILDAARDRWPDLRHVDGHDLDEARALARSVDTAIIVVGSTYLDEGEFIGSTDPALMHLFPPGDDPDLAAEFARELAALSPPTVPTHVGERPAGFATGGDRASLRLMADQVALIRTVAAANPRTAVVIQGGSAVLVDEWANEVGAVAMSWYGGSLAGAGLLDVLTGSQDATGRLPFSVPRKEADLPDFDPGATNVIYDEWHGWWRLEHNATPAAYPFGFGLSYNTYRLEPGSLTIEHDDNTVVVRAQLACTGKYAGADVIGVYALLPNSKRRRLVGFTRVCVTGESVVPVEITVARSTLCTRDTERHTWIDAIGDVEITAARFAGDPDALRATITL